MKVRAGKSLRGEARDYLLAGVGNGISCVTLTINAVDQDKTILLQFDVDDHPGYVDALIRALTSMRDQARRGSQ